MVKKKKEAKFFKIRPETEKEHMALDVLYSLKNGQDPTSSAGGRNVSDYIDLCKDKGLLEGPGGGGEIAFKQGHKKILGIGFRDSQCFLTVIDLNGNILDKESIEIDLLLHGTGKNKDFTGVVRQVGEKTKFSGEDFACCGVAIPEAMIGINPKSVTIFSNGIKDIFGCDVFMTTSATAAGYGDRENLDSAKNKNILYMYSDVGTGVVLKGESIFEADEYNSGKDGEYLRPWNQFSIVNTTKDLAASGVGTDVVEMVKGDIDNITLDVVFQAAGNSDELAEDLIKRSGLALGVRVAYLVNMFDVDHVVFGGGIESDEEKFIQYVKESMNKFLSGEKIDELKMIPGVLGKESSSVGAALLCRREIFMEV